MFLNNHIDQRNGLLVKPFFSTINKEEASKQGLLLCTVGQKHGIHTWNSFFQSLKYSFRGQVLPYKKSKYVNFDNCTTEPSEPLTHQAIPDIFRRVYFSIKICPSFPHPDC